MTNKTIQIAHVELVKNLSQISIVLDFLNSIYKLWKSVLTEHTKSSKLKAALIINSLFEHQHRSLLWDTREV